MNVMLVILVMGNPVKVRKKIIGKIASKILEFLEKPIVYSKTWSRNYSSETTDRRNYIPVIQSVKIC